MNKEKFDVPVGIDAAILQYAAEKRFVKRHWILSFPVKAAAVLVLASVFATVYFSGKKEAMYTQVAAVEEAPDWQDFEEKLEYVNEEIFLEAQYLAQL